MVNTPTIWKARYRLNHTDAGNQYDPDIVDIGMGRYAAVWTEGAGGPIGASDNKNVVGQIFDAEGHRVGAEFQVNQSFFAINNDEDAALATRPGGGFVAVYQDGKRILADAYDVDGNHITAGAPLAIDLNATPDVISSPAIATRPNGSYLVAYDRKHSSDGTTDIVGRTVDAAGTLSNEFTIFNSSDTTRHPDVAALSNGNYVVVFEDADTAAAGSDYDPQFSIVDATGAAVTAGAFATGAHNQTDVHVAALAGGGFVSVWDEKNGDGDHHGIRAAIYSNAGAVVVFLGQGAASPFTVNTTTAGDQIKPEITALPDGGFVVVWDDLSTGRLRGQRFDDHGNKVGSEFVAGSLGQENGPVVAALGDGRFIAGFAQIIGDGDVHGTIFDPRGHHITGTDGNDVLTARKNGAEVIGKKGSDILIGRKGDDELHGNNGSDKLAGARGKDKLWGNNGHDKFVFDTVLGNGNVDRIKDMQHNTDKIWLDKDIFSAIGNKLGSGEFQKGHNADDGNDYIIYKKAKGKLFYDPDGDGPTDKIAFAKVDPGTKLDNDDFHMIHDLVI